jgi:ELWxxDGT repeat protein
MLQRAAVVFLILGALAGRVHGQATLVKDIRPGFEPMESSPRDLTTLGNEVFFVADHPTAGDGLWRSDGTAAGTRLVKDFSPFGTTSVIGLAASGSTLFFDGPSPTLGSALWKSDGTAAGTVPVKDLTLQTFIFERSAPATVNGVLFFGADDGVAGYELWRSDGTEAGTFRVKDILPGKDSSSPQWFTAVNGVLFFTAYDGVTGQELWRSDGTEAGTVRVKDIRPGPGGSEPEELTDGGGVLFFVADDGVTDPELWRSDGTAAGTLVVKDVEPLSLWPQQLTRVGNTLFFVSFTELWKSDGTAAGTVPVPGLASGTVFGELTDVNGVLYLAADGVGSDAGGELWRSDGTALGTHLVKDIRPGSSSSSPERLINVDGLLFFNADDGVHGDELWRSDGTAAGTVMMADLKPGPAGNGPLERAAAGGLLFFAYFAEGELWRTDGTAPGTFTVTAIRRPFGSFPDDLTAFGPALAFTAFGVDPDTTLWRSDGTESGTVGLGGLSARQLTPAQGRLFFFDYDSGTGRSELWASDGTAAGTALLRNIAIPPANALMDGLQATGGRIFFLGHEGLSGMEPWRTDGTAGGTVRIRDIRPGPLGSTSGFSTLGSAGSLYFAADDGTSGLELWRSDGSEAGTILLRDIQPGAASSQIFVVAKDVGTVYFVDRPGTPWRLWKTDGTTPGTVLVKDGLQAPGHFTPSGGLLFFTEASPSTGRELWKSDGTAAGTVPVADVRPGPTGSEPEELTNVGGVLFFTADDGVHGRELWKSDGTPAGTVLVLDITPGPAGPHPENLVAVGSRLYFSAVHAAAGLELWRSDGTADGTVLAADVAPGAAPSAPERMRPAAGQLFFSADDGITGRELWTLPLPGTLWAGDAQAVESGGSVTFTVSLTTPSASAVTVQYATVNGTAAAPGDYTASAGTLTFAPGTTSRTVVVPVNMDTADEADESFFLRLSAAAGADLVDAEGEGTIRDDDGPSASIADVSIPEGSGGATTAVVTVALSAASVQGVSVAYSTASGTATAPADYTSTSGRVDFAPGATASTLSVPVNPDTMDEFDETFVVNLTNPQNATLADNQATVTIVDDDLPPTIAVSDFVVLEGNQGTTTAAFSAALSAPSGKTVQVQFATRNGTAVAGTDYTAASGGLTFAPGTTDRPVSVSVTGDSSIEPDETFFVDLASPVEVTLGDPEGRATILDDDLGRGFHTVPPCRLADTRNPPGSSGGPALGANTRRAFPVVGRCAVPATARAVVVNVTAVNPGEVGNFRLYPAGGAAPTASVLNFQAARTRAGNATIALGLDGQIAVQCDMPPGSTASTHFVLDVSGYYE